MDKIIKEAMDANNINSEQELANIMGVHTYTARAMINGSKQISLSTYSKTINELGFKLKYRVE